MGTMSNMRSPSRKSLHTILNFPETFANIEIFTVVPLKYFDECCPECFLHDAKLMKSIVHQFNHS